MTRFFLCFLLILISSPGVYSQKRKTPKSSVSVDIPSGLLTGESTLEVSSTTAQIKIGLAETGVSLIEFPVTDRLYLVHPGVGVGMIGGAESQVSPQDIVVVDSTRRGPHDPLVLRPGPAFPSKGVSGCRALLTVQMVSGLIVTIQIFHVTDVARNANRVVVSYDTARIIQARSKAGLATVLTQQSEPFSKEAGSSNASNSPAKTPENNRGVSQTVEPVSSTVSSSPPLPGPGLPVSQTQKKAPAPEAISGGVAPPGPATPAKPQPAEAVSGKGPQADSTQAGDVALNSPVLAEFSAQENYDQFITVEDPLAVTQSILDQLLQLAASQKTAPFKFTKPVQGISLSARENVFLNSKKNAFEKRIQIVLVAVRNVSKSTIQLIPTDPLVRLETGPSGTPLNLENLEIVGSKNSGESILKPGEIKWYAVAFPARGTGINQRVVLTVAHSAAADQPAKVVVFGFERE